MKKQLYKRIMTGAIGTLDSWRDFYNKNYRKTSLNPHLDFEVWVTIFLSPINRNRFLRSKIK